MSTTTADPRPAPATAAPVDAPSGHLFSPWTDFFLLGGTSLLIVPWFWLLDGYFEYAAVLAATTFFAHFINNPHFAHSYHLFYRGFVAKGFAPEYPRDWRRRYLFAGVAVPLLLIGFFAFGIVTRSTRLLGYSVNLMFFTVGWHYVKQGYGMLMLDSVLKRRFFAESEKKLLLVNAYAVWGLSWLDANQLAYKADFWGIAYYTFALPKPALAAAFALAAATTAWALFMLARKAWKSRTLPPVSGLVAYFVSAYLWLLYRDPIVLLLFPALHSLQYLVVVWRYELNYQSARCGTDVAAPRRRIARLALRMAAFYGIAIGLGYAGFWWLPRTLGSWLPDATMVSGGGAFLLSAWVFINVHHYFMDSVIWRKGNPETGRYLFR